MTLFENSSDIIYFFNGIRASLLAVGTLVVFDRLTDSLL